MVHKNIVSRSQGRLSFFLPQPCTSERFRDECSRWMCDDARLQSLDPVQIRKIFHHDADRRPSNSLSPFRFEADAHWGHVYAIADNNTALLRQVADAFATTPLPTPWLGAPRWEETHVALEPQSRSISYCIPQMVVCKNAEQHHLWKAADAQSKAKHVQDLVKRGIERQMALLTGSDSHLSVSPQVHLISHERAIPRVRHAQANAFARVACVAVDLPLRLDGHWAAGGLVSRGYGRIQAILQAV